MASESNKLAKNKLLCLDLDGTLYNSNHRVSPANAKMVSEASKNGYEICLCSGRGPTMYVPTAKELGVEGGIYMVGYNGAVVYRLDEDGCIFHRLFETLMTKEQVMKILKFTQDLGVEMDVGDKLYAKVPKGEEHRKLLKAHTDLCGSSAEILLSLHSKTPNKISVLTNDPKEFVDMCNSIEGFCDDGIGIVVGGKFWCETINLSHDKKVGISLVLKEIGLAFEDCLYFGDGANDATSLKNCGLGIAMKSAKPEAIASANFVSEWTNDEDAVAKELEILLNEEKT
mmetsp:Transcript_4431/g.4904  ORF Transcript_4431/g.4904 Transcript_4431/m.4904 type:complete len:285 (+) Transcript_4431:314-1168(+)